MPTARSGLSTSVVNGKIYAIGGQAGKAGPGGGPLLSTVEVYDPATDTWKKKADMPTARGWFSTSVVNGKIYAIGGGVGGLVFSTVEVYDPATDTWTRKADMLAPRGGLSTSVVNGKIYAIGGWPGPAFTSNEEYDTGFTGEEKNKGIEPKCKLATSWGSIKAGY